MEKIHNYHKYYLDPLCIENFHKKFNQMILQEIKEEFTYQRTMNKNYVKDRESDFNNENEDIEIEFAKFIGV